MSKMRAIEAAVLVMRREGVDTAFGIPGAAINPLYSALQKVGGIDHVLARHVEGASHMSEFKREQTNWSRTIEVD